MGLQLPPLLLQEIPGQCYIVNNYRNVSKKGKSQVHLVSITWLAGRIIVSQAPTQDLILEWKKDLRDCFSDSIQNCWVNVLVREIITKTQTKTKTIDQNVM